MVQYESEHHHLVATAPLDGVEFDDDNDVVYDHLKSWTMKGPAFT